MKKFYKLLKAIRTNYGEDSEYFKEMKELIETAFTITEKKKYYIHLFDYEQGQAIFESDFFETEGQAIEFAKSCNFHTTENINVEIMVATFENEEYVNGKFLRNLEYNEYGRC